MANKAGTQAILDELWQPAIQQRINPDVWSRIEAGVTAGAEVARVLEKHQGQAFLAVRKPEIAKRLQQRISKEADASAAKVEGFSALQKELGG